MIDKELLTKQPSKELLPNSDTLCSKEMLSTFKELFVEDEILFIEEVASMVARTIPKGGSSSCRKVAAKNGPYWTPENLEIERKVIEEYKKKRWEIECQREKEISKEKYEKEREEMANRWKERRRRKGKL